MIKAVNHIQLTVPPGETSRARDFYCDCLGLREIVKPLVLQKNGGFWMQLGPVQIHVGEEAGSQREKTKAHICYEVSDLSHWKQKLAARGIEILDGNPFPGVERFEFRDPFGNRVEIMEYSETPESTAYTEKV